MTPSISEAIAAFRKRLAECETSAQVNQVWIDFDDNRADHRIAPGSFVYGELLCLTNEKLHELIEQADREKVR